MSNGKVSDKVFDMMTAAADKTDVSLEKPAKLDKGTKSIHTALMAAGMTPAYGNIADITDAALYLLEGELGNAAWSAAAAIPIIGQMVSGKRALKVAKEAGEETVKIYRGTSKWHKGEMVVEGKHVSPTELLGSAGGQPTKKRGIWASNLLEEAESYREIDISTGRKLELLTGKAKDSKGIILEYEVPKSWYEKHLSKWNDPSWEGYGSIGWFEGGIPKEWLTKVHK
jgi:hypothetical protein